MKTLCDAKLLTAVTGATRNLASISFADFTAQKPFLPYLTLSLQNREKGKQTASYLP